MLQRETSAMAATRSRPLSQCKRNAFHILNGKNDEAISIVLEDTTRLTSCRVSSTNPFCATVGDSQWRFVSFNVVLNSIKFWFHIFSISFLFLIKSTLK